MADSIPEFNIAPPKGFSESDDENAGGNMDFPDMPIYENKNKNDRKTDTYGNDPNQAYKEVMKDYYLKQQEEEQEAELEKEKLKQQNEKNDGIKKNKTKEDEEREQQREADDRAKFNPRDKEQGRGDDKNWEKSKSLPDGDFDHD